MRGGVNFLWVDTEQWLSSGLYWLVSACSSQVKEKRGEYYSLAWPVYCVWREEWIGTTIEVFSDVWSNYAEYNEPITELPIFVTRIQNAEGHQLFWDDFTMTFGHKPNTTMWIVESHKFDKRRKFHTWTFFEIGMEDKTQFVRWEADSNYT